MTSRWHRIEQLFEQAIALPPSERDCFLQGSSEDPSVRREVATLVACADGADAFLHATISAAIERLRDE